MIIEDPLNWQNLEVYDIATARYALKIANDHYYAIIHMREQMEKELARSAAEVYNQSLRLVQMYLTQKEWTDHYGNYRLVPISYVPNPIPEEVPLRVRNGIAYMNEQLVVERERAEAELADQSESLQEIIDHLEELVRIWARQQFTTNPGWVNGLRNFTLGGCTLTFADNDISFSYAELSYE